MINTVLKGRLERWNDNKGFGFVSAEQGKEDIFVHISAFKNSHRRPLVGDVIFYQTDVGNDGKIKAINARIEGVAVVKTRSSYRNKQKSNQNQWLSKFIILVLFVTIGLFLYAKVTQYRYPDSNSSTELATSSSHHDLVLKDAFVRQASHLQAEGEGIVSRILPDDTKGDRHQKFLVTLNSGQTLLIAHNIDLAGRIDALQEDDRIAFNGEYEWNAKGGVIHWTHHDPQCHHAAGWLKHKGHVYQ